jgi:hyperosmotically inducible protein
MKAYIRILCLGISVALVAAIGSAAPPAAQAVTSGEMAASVERVLARLPYYGVFDYLVFRIDHGTIYLAGYSSQGNLKADAERAAKRAHGVEVVVNTIEILPLSLNDDRIRWETYYRIYTDAFLQRYAPGGVFSVLRELREERLFPGMQPIGRYPVHIIVKDGRTSLVGTVDSAVDRQVAELRAREVFGVFEVVNHITVNETGRLE